MGFDVTLAEIIYWLKQLVAFSLAALLIYVFIRVRAFGRLPVRERQNLIDTFGKNLDESVKGLSNNPERLNQIMRRVQGAAGILLMLVGYFTGHIYFALIQDGVRAQGTIVDFQYKSWTTVRSNGTYSWTSAYMPIVEFRVNDKNYRFQNWWGSSSAAGKNTKVPIFFNAQDPAIAMIDKGLQNWIPWAPIFCTGVFLMLVSIFGKRRYQPVDSGPIQPT